MRILYSVTCAEALNPFVKSLTAAIAAEDSTIEFVFDPSFIWTEKVYTFDILHIMWPEFLVEKGNHTARDLKKRLIEIKDKGIRIVSTCHNIVPHYCKDSDKCEAIRICYGLSDVIHHLGTVSLDELAQTYPNVRHELIPHHIYDNIYEEQISKTEACRRLGLSENCHYILSIGAIRDKEEKELLDYVAKKVKRGINIIVPSFAMDAGKRTDITQRFKYYRDKYLKYHNRLICNIGIIKNQDLPYYMAVSDITLIHRKRILNSGNVTLGMYAGNVIIGPQIGNVGRILKETGNYTFDAQEEIPGLIEKALKAADDGKGVCNRQYALSNWSSSQIAKLVLNNYRTLIGPQ